MITILRLDMRAEFKKVEARFLNVESKIENLTSAIYSIKALVEEQNSRNLYILDGYNFLYHEQTMTKERLERIEKEMFGSPSV